MENGGIGAYTEKDLHLMVSLNKFFRRVKSCVRKEVSMRNRKILPPSGFLNIARLESCTKYYDLIWHTPIKMDSIDVSNEICTSMSEALAIANRITCEEQLDTDTLSILADPSGWVDSRLMGWFVDLCNANIHNNTYILLDTALRVPQNKENVIPQLNPSGGDRWIFIPSILGNNL